MARLAVQAGHFLALHTRRPEPSPTPPEGDGSNAGPVRDGWVNIRGWRRIVPCSAPQGPSPLDPVLVARRMTSSPSAVASNLRQLFERAARPLRTPEDLPDGAALTIGASILPNEWWGHVQDGWRAALTGVEQGSVRPLPAVPEGWSARDLEQAVTWLAEQTDLGEVWAALQQTRPRVAREALDLLGYDRPDLPDCETRTVVARLLSLYAGALSRGDQEVIGLVRDLCRAAAGTRHA
ncbi:hypothetical protein [Streptomyces griseus]|uniref:hypothetical protein n=1 Tax=Streptomyces griseus TaxID=1911 RepID=UPI0037A9842F